MWTPYKPAALGMGLIFNFNIGQVASGMKLAERSLYFLHNSNEPVWGREMKLKEGKKSAESLIYCMSRLSVAERDTKN